MPIQVVCPGCKKRFQVSDKFAGKQGPCPSCKATIKIPDKGEEVTIHAPDEVKGPDGKAVPGQPNFKPIRRTHLTASPVTIVAILGGVMVTLIATLVISASTDENNPVGMAVLAPGALLLAVPMAWGGYVFLRDPELAGFQGGSLYLRVGICAFVYALLWAIWSLVLRPLWGFEPELPWIVAVVPGLVAVGALASFSSLNLDYLTAALHYGFYLGICILLRVIMHLPPL